MQIQFAVAVFALNRGSVLTIKQNGLWLPVEGLIEEGELPLRAAMRNLYEQTGLTGFFSHRPRGLAGSPDGFIGYAEHSEAHAAHEVAQRTFCTFCFMAFVPSRSCAKGDVLWTPFGEGVYPTRVSVNQCLQRIYHAHECGEISAER